ncbi:short chain dehydrogenase family protein [Paraburkholderia xenovorans LB400]|nr:short chain dehydrogenase family protein [Paraburkholderia xenovorans LB400]
MTGGASGIGAAICRAFDAQGAKLAVLDVDRDSGETFARSLRGAVFIECDVADAASVKRAFERIAQRWDRTDVLVNNAGIVGREEYGRVQTRRVQQIEDVRSGRKPGPLRATVSLTDEQWRRMIDIHLNGTFYCTREALLQMERLGQGAIVNMSSIAGLDGGFGNPHYAAAKAGILGFTRAVAKEAIQQGIRVNAVAPGFVDSPLRRSLSEALQQLQIAATPMGRAATGDEIASLVLFLASDDASYLVGETISPNGGYLTI